MKQYKIIKIVFAKDFQDAVKKEKNSEIVDIMLNEDVVLPTNNKLGFSCR